MKENKNIDKFIKQNINIEKPSLDFSNKVMSQVKAIELNNEKAFSSLMQKNLLETPSVNFTTNIMSIINQDSKVSIYNPVISKKAWILITSFVLILFGYTIFNLEFSQTYFAELEKYIPSYTMNISFQLPQIITSPLFATSIFALSALLFIDYFIRNRRFSL